jgi:hypothetical protein
LEERFTSVLRRLHFDPEVLEWAAQALQNDSAADRRYREETLTRLRQRHDRLQNRIDQMYLDKLDGRIGAEFFDQKADEWRQEQSRIQTQIAHHGDVGQDYVAEGVELLHLANRAASLFKRQPASEKRRLLDFVLSNSTWKEGQLDPVFRQPFDIIADAAAMSANEKAAGNGSDGLHQVKYTPEDSNL